ncbi:ADP-ribose pyrophosphatase YjhB (NUDIX family) [Peribacillus deserti]|uniref:ADP-ribose pyrophosphatase YjhB (NUDIX family) n=1 Tax=Peribacillus deserti TaxID=673318 RepID=A0ABS2QEL4_9BACI|nr:ADP-ribose pyrophosphatase YjhB (NUDIX family) [Peribacillus deserti]
MRNRGSVIIIENHRIALIKRERDRCVYYVFPGGGIEAGESPSAAAKREAFEELGVSVLIKELFGTAEYNGTQYFFLAHSTGGDFGTGQGQEFFDSGRGRGTYKPIWVEINSLSSLDVRPRQITEKILKYYGNGCYR